MGQPSFPSNGPGAGLLFVTEPVRKPSLRRLQSESKWTMPAASSKTDLFGEEWTTPAGQIPGSLQGQGS